MNYKILDSRNDSKNATRYDALISIESDVQAPQPKKERGFWDTLWNGPDDDDAKENEPEPDNKNEVYAMRISSTEPGYELDTLVKAVVDKKDKWKYNVDKQLWYTNIPNCEGWAFIKAEKSGMPLADYFKPGKRKIVEKKSAKKVVAKKAVAKKTPKEKPDPHML